MLKKLVKYGNSNALVLDKALLELLNIEEGSLVKLRTDGSSLIITAQHKASEEKISPTITQEDIMKEIVNSHLAKHYGSAENGRAYINELRAVHARHAQLDTPEIKHKLEETDKEIKAISKKYIPQEKNVSINAIDAFKKVHEKYQHVLSQMCKLANENADYIHESVLLAEKHHATKNSPEYVEEYAELITKYIPDYADYQKEIKMVADSLK